MIKKLRILCMAFLMLFVTGCNSSISIDEAREEFSKYHTDNNVALVNDDFFYFDEYEFRLRDIAREGEYCLAYIILNDYIYFGISKETGFFDFTFSIWRCTIEGRHRTELYTKKTSTHPWCIKNGNTIYVEYYENSTVFNSSARRIDAYDIETGDYYNVASGADHKLDDYREKTPDPKYNCEIQDNDFIIEDPVTSKSVRIDETFLSNTIYYESLQKYKLKPLEMNYSNGHILLSYSIGDSFSTYSYLVFELDFETNDFVYKLLTFTFAGSVNIIYIV